MLAAMIAMTMTSQMTMTTANAANSPTITTTTIAMTATTTMTMAMATMTMTSFTRRHMGVDSAYAACCSDVGFELIRIGWGLIQPMASSSRADSAAHSLCLLRASLCVSLVSCSLLNELLADDEVGDLGDGGWASAWSQEGVGVHSWLSTGPRSVFYLGPTPVREEL